MPRLRRGNGTLVRRRRRRTGAKKPSRKACSFGRSRATGRCRKKPSSKRKPSCRFGRSKATGRCRKKPASKRKRSCRFGRSKTTGRCRKAPRKSQSVYTKRACRYGRRPGGKCSRKGERRHVARSFVGPLRKSMRGCRYGRAPAGACRGKKLKGRRLKSGRRSATGKRLAAKSPWIRYLKSQGYMRKGSGFKPLPKKGSSEGARLRAGYRGGASPVRRRSARVAARR